LIKDSIDIDHANLAKDFIDTDNERIYLQSLQKPHETALLEEMTTY
jgi:hypothetical protein